MNHESREPRPHRCSVCGVEMATKAIIAHFTSEEHAKAMVDLALKAVLRHYSMAPTPSPFDHDNARKRTRAGLRVP